MWVFRGANTTSRAGFSNQPETINNACVLLVQLHIAAADQPEMTVEIQVICPNFEVQAGIRASGNSEARAAGKP